MSDTREPAAEAAGEPSMEDILASIRRILSEEADEAEDKPASGAPLPKESDAGARGAGADRPDPFDAGAMDEDGDSPDGFGDGGVDDDVGEIDDIDEVEALDPFDGPGNGAAAAGSFASAVPLSDPYRAPAVFDLTPSMRVPGTGIMSPPTINASTDVLTQLARAILDRRDIAIGAREVTLEGMVREMLRPLLKEWLDRNLPYLIERLVKKEIDVMINRAERLED